MKLKAILIIPCIFFFACSTAPAAYNGFKYMESMPEANEITSSLFSSDTAVLSNEAVDQILDGKLTWEGKNKIVVLNIPTNRSVRKYYGYYYWRSEEYQDTLQKYNSTLLKALLANQLITDAAILPSFMIPKEITIPSIREAAIRMQANLLLVYKIESDIFEKWRFLQSTQLKAFATGEAFLLDTRTGIIPFSTIITKKHITEKEKQDANLVEASKRAESEVILLALEELGKELTVFFNSMAGNNNQ